MSCVWHALQFILRELLKPYQHNHRSRWTLDVGLWTEQTASLTQVTRQATLLVKIMD